MQAFFLYPKNALEPRTNSNTVNVVLGREFPSKKRGEPLSCHILQDTNNFVKWRAENFLRRETLSRNIFHMGYGIPEIIPFPVRLPLILLERNV